MLVPVLLGTSIIAFSLMHLAPGDPARTIAGEHASQQTINRIREKYGLDKPIYVQYGIWLGDVLRGNMGRSIASNEYVTGRYSIDFPVHLSLLSRQWSWLYW